MKKGFYTLAFCVLALSSVGQNFTVQTNDTTLFGTPNESTFYGDIDLYNSLDVDLQMTWENISQEVTEGWTTSNCDNDQCHPIGQLIGEFVLDASSNGYINQHFYPNEIEGDGMVQIKVYETGFPDDFEILTFNGQAESVNVENLQTAELKLFPNPTITNLNISLTGVQSYPVVLKIVDIIGQTVHSELLETNLTTIDVMHLKKGIYFAKLGDSQTIQFIKS